MWKTRRLIRETTCLSVPAFFRPVVISLLCCLKYRIFPSTSVLGRRVRRVYSVKPNLSTRTSPIALTLYGIHSMPYSSPLMLSLE